MTWLLDVSLLVAYLMNGHVHYRRASAWRANRSLAVCPITELGFLRIACAVGWTMPQSREALTKFINREKLNFIPCDFRVLDGTYTDFPRKTTDLYLADLAASRGWRLATLDAGITHPAVELIPAFA